MAGRPDAGARVRAGGRRRGSWAARAAAANAVGLLAGAGLDAVFADPRHGHPVAGHGGLAGVLERQTYRPSRRAGAVHVAVGVGVPVAAAAWAGWATRRRPVLRAALVAATTWAVLGGASLRHEAHVMADELDHGDLYAARTRLPHLCGRDPSSLGAEDLARATVESVAENTSDAVVAPLCWGALAGLPGLVGYRAVNTLDAMIGRRSPRYERFGWAAARLDDAANLAPSRLTAALTVAAAGVVRGSRSEAFRVWLADGGRHPSPNAGQCEAAMAGALGVRLGGRNAYEGRVEHRPELGSGRPPRPDDARRAARLSAVVGAVAAALCAGHALAAPWRLRALRAWRRR
ncbi:MAG: cobalamin biosynthesis protein [Micromonosporaceae bacterium]|nr:cobalamin biosynthesis protein [Micromonosporaceae bacterium]